VGSFFHFFFSPCYEQQFKLDSNPLFNIEQFGVLLTLLQLLAYLPQTFNYILNCVSLHLFLLCAKLHLDLAPRCPDQQFNALSNALQIQVIFIFLFFCPCAEQQ
jgi:hypothetical protein